jgi:uncharacterized protein YbcI
MNEENGIKPQVEKAVTKFAKDYIGVTPKSVVVDIHAQSVLATLQGIIPPVEKDYANGEPEGGDLLEKCYSNAFDTTKKAFEAELENILGQVVESSMLRIDPRSGNAVMILNLTDESPAQKQ